jgi:hypothetical protein
MMNTAPCHEVRYFRTVSNWSHILCPGAHRREKPGYPDFILSTLFLYEHVDHSGRNGVTFLRVVWNIVPLGAHQVSSCVPFVAFELF